MRQPVNVLIFPFRITGDGPQYAIFKRSDDANWQGVCGGVEDNEDLVTAARRETAEEAGVYGLPMYELDMVSGVEKVDFVASRHWPEKLYIVRKHFFGMDATRAATQISISGEHHQFRWAGYAEAYAALRYDDDKTALWELDARLRKGDLPEAAV